MEDRVTIKIGNQEHSAPYSVERGIVTVRHPLYGSRSTQVGGSPPETIARMLLREIVSKG